MLLFMQAGCASKAPSSNNEAPVGINTNNSPKLNVDYDARQFLSKEDVIAFNHIFPDFDQKPPEKNWEWKDVDPLGLYTPAQNRQTRRDIFLFELTPQNLQDNVGTLTLIAHLTNRFLLSNKKMEPLDYKKPVIVRYGTESLPFYIEKGFSVVDLVFNEKMVAVLGYSPFNAKVLRNGIQLDYHDEIIPGESLVIETRANFKAGLPGPKFHKCERFRRKNGFEIETSKGDHAKWIVDGQAVSVNYCNGELDIKSLKELARQLNLKPRELINNILTI